MGEGFLKIELFAGDYAYPVRSSDIQILKDGVAIFKTQTDENGKTGTIKLETPSLRDHDGISAPPCRAVYDVIVCGGDEFKKVIINGVQVYDGITSILPVQMVPLIDIGQKYTDVRRIEIPYDHGCDLEKNQEGPTDMGDYSLEEPVVSGASFPLNATLVTDIALPDFVTVHLGHPSNTSAPSVRVRFIDYVKNVASSEIYPTWEDAALRANILCQISFVLNRIYTEKRRFG